MESNFHLETSRKGHEYHINLHGVFDGASAFELLEAIQQGEKQGLTMFIDTTHLREALPFGQTILEFHLPRDSNRQKLNFTGLRAEAILPKGCRFLDDYHKKGHKCTGDCKNCRCRRQAKAKNNITHKAS
ncbi:hypothetical protein [Desulfobacter sp.]|jgi:hypothetical protein|uniref:hypothetical protein n=1 Tax=Desulfobacter sp. TaxID=2294 RepID=UPI003D10B846